MYTVMIADDDAMILKGLKEIVNWNQLGFEIAGAVRDGEEGLQLAQQIRPDVVLTDIKMPHLSGLEMIEKCIASGVQSRFVVLTGFDEFEFARRALKNQVTDYLLKPIEETELIAVLTDIRLKLDEGEKRKDDLRELERRLHENHLFLREKFIGNMIKGTLMADQMSEENLRFYNISLVGKYYKVALMDLGGGPGRAAGDVDRNGDGDGAHRDAGRQGIRLMEIAQEAMDKRGLHALVSTMEDRLLVMLNSHRDEFPGLQEGLKEMMQAAFRLLGCQATVGVSTTSGFNELPVLYRESARAVQNRMYAGKGSIIEYSGLDIPAESGYSYPDKQVRELITAISENSQGKVHAAIDLIFSGIRQLGTLPPDQVYRMCTEIMFEVRKALEAIGIHLNVMNDGDTGYPEQLFACETLEDLKKWFYQTFIKIMNAVNGRQDRLSGDNIEPIILYINTNYDKEIDLDLISRTFYIEPSYFCKVFKKRTGETYLGYLTRIRIAKACELLKNPDVKVYEIASRVGYEDQRYFSQLFRKHVGMAPSDYQKNQTKN
ncbi:response regulator [Paenibacillus sepulcri]|uniref:Response regulator n=1 Tax=Paenibacillus sepulcri TaxID=359917 RepID=A0ABS7BYA6_9BACL|nr:response regulator [Paenibacillus sepulcri]